MKYLGIFYQVDTLKVVVTENVGVQSLYRVFLWLHKKEQEMVQNNFQVGKCWLPH